MKILALLLFVAGLFWAYVCLGFLGLPFGAIWETITGEGDPKFGLPDHLLFMLLFLNSAVGYWVWWGWLHYFRKERYLGGERRRFWSISIANHGLWVVLLPFLFGAIFLNEFAASNLLHTWRTGFFGGGWFYLIWPATILVLSSALMNEKKKSNQPVETTETAARPPRLT